METTAPTIAIVSILRILATVAIAISLPVFLLTSSVRSVTLDEGFYLSQFAKYQVGTVTHLPDAELRRVARGFIDYFESRANELQMTVNTTGGTVELFNDRELRHMADVKSLMQRVFRLRTIAAIVLLASAATIVTTGLVSAPSSILRATAIGGGTAAVVIGLVAVAAALDFDRLFTQFHFISFTNDLWLFDPTRDRLIQLFPLGFFYDAALRIGIYAVGFGLAILVASLGLLYTLTPTSSRS